MDIFDQMAAKHPAPVIARRNIAEFTGGAVKPKQMANLDSLGEGCPDRLLINGHICYPVASFVTWLRHRSKGA